MPVEPALRPPIAVLPAAVADAIAAGEVVDRPAAVVKELLENAIDAGARRIAVRVEDAGRGLIEVADDGWGIPEGQLSLAFLRHATSKIRTVEDMRAVQSLGFRGEALASIAAVADVEAVSRPASALHGQRLRVVAGSVTEEGTAGGPPGTRVSVRRLFFNTPARLRFLKQPSTETALIQRVATELALAYPEVALSLHVDGRRLFATPGTEDLRAVVAAVYGLEVAAALLDVLDPPVRGLLAPPSLHRASRDQLTILVNRRCIQHRSLAFAVEQAYRGLREPDRSPIAILALELDPADIDVNVHPTKREVRFRNEGVVFQALERACYRALRRSGLYTLAANPTAGALHIQEAPVNVAVQWAAGNEAGGAVVAAHPSGAHDTDESADSGILSTGSAARRLPAMQYVGQVLNAYLVAQASGALVLLDQHAAHERVLFDRLLDRLQRGESPGSQLLLVPQLVEVSAEQAAIVLEQKGWIEGLGFGLDAFGANTVRLSATPAGLPEGRTADLLSRILDQLARDLPRDLRLRETAALLACHTAVRFGDPLTPAAAQALLTDLGLTAEPISCPHGRPTTLVLPDGELRRLFKRP